MQRLFHSGAEALMNVLDAELETRSREMLAAVGRVDADCNAEMVQEIALSESLCRVFSEKCMKAAEENGPILYALAWLRIRRQSFNIFNAEMVEVLLRASYLAIEGDVGREHDVHLVELLKELRTYVNEGILGYNKQAILDFLFRMLLRKSRAAKTAKVFAFELYMQGSTPVGRDAIEVVLGGAGCLDVFGVAGVRFRDHIVLTMYQAAVFQGSAFSSENHGFFMDLLLQKLAPDSNADLNLFGQPSSHSELLSVSFASYLFENLKSVDDVDVKQLEMVLKDLVYALRRTEYSEEEVLWFSRMFPECKVRTVVCRLCRSIILLLLQMIERKDLSRVKASRILSRADVRDVPICRKTMHRVARMARKLLRGKSVMAVEAVVNVMSQMDPQFLLREMQRPHTVSTRRKIFDAIRSRFQCEAMYRMYLELLGNEETRDVRYRIDDIDMFARVFFSWERKSVCRFLDIDIESVENAFVAELGVHYSLFHPERVDEVCVASVLLEGGEEIVRSRNVWFYKAVMRILINLESRTSLALRRRLAMFLRRLVFYSPYTRTAGMLINALGYGAMEFPRKTDYFITILGSCGHPSFREHLGEYPWSANKERGLVYSLRFDPELGAAYRWKLEEILKRLECVEEKDAAVCTEFLEYLREAVASDCASDFLFELVAKSHRLLVSGAASDVPGVSNGCCALLVAATNARAVLAHVSMPVVLSYSFGMPEMIQMHSEAVLSGMCAIVENKMSLFRRRREVTESRTIHDIYMNVDDKSRVVDRVSALFDDCPLRTYYLLIQAARFDQKDFSAVMDAVVETMHSCDPKKRLLLKIYSLFADVCGTRPRRLCISNKEIFFTDALDDEIECLVLHAER